MKAFSYLFSYHLLIFISKVYPGNIPRPICFTYCNSCSGDAQEPKKTVTIRFWSKIRAVRERFSSGFDHAVNMINDSGGSGDILLTWRPVGTIAGAAAGAAADAAAGVIAGTGGAFRQV